MTDAIGITTGSMVNIWAEEVGAAGSYYAQIMKLADGTAEGHQTVPAGSDYGLAVDVRRFTSGSLFTTGCLDRLTSACIDRITAGSLDRIGAITLVDAITTGSLQRVAAITAVDALTTGSLQRVAAITAVDALTTGSLQRVAAITAVDALTTGSLQRVAAVTAIDSITTGSLSKVAIDQTTHGTTNRVAVHGGITVSQTPTLQIVGAYTASDAVGGKLTFANAARVTGGKGIVNSVTVIDNDKENAALRLWLFNQDFTATGDADAFDPTDADLANCSGVVPIDADQYYSANDNSVACVRGVGLQYQLTGTAMYGQLQTTGTPTYSASPDITVSVSFEWLD